MSEEEITSSGRTAMKQDSNAKVNRRDLLRALGASAVVAPGCRQPKPIRKTTMKSAKPATKRTLRTSKRFTASITIPSEGRNRADKEDRSSGAPRLHCGHRGPQRSSRPTSVFVQFSNQRRERGHAWHAAI